MRYSVAQTYVLVRNFRQTSATNTLIDSHFFSSTVSLIVIVVSLQAENILSYSDIISVPQMLLRFCLSCFCLVSVARNKKEKKKTSLSKSGLTGMHKFVFKIPSSAHVFTKMTKKKIHIGHPWAAVPHNKTPAARCDGAFSTRILVQTISSLSHFSFWGC